MKLGISGALTRRFITSPLTPLLLLAAILIGLFATVTISREEDPPIHVPFVDIVVNTDGLRAADAVELATKPLETILRGVPGVEHIYSTTVDNQVTVTARFVVGTNEDDAVLRVNDKIRANIDRIPIGIPEPLVIGHGIERQTVSGQRGILVVALLDPQAEVDFVACQAGKPEGGEFGAQRPESHQAGLHGRGCGGVVSRAKRLPRPPGAPGVPVALADVMHV